MSNSLQVVIRTPQSVVVETDADSVRVLSETGHVGLRPRMEHIILALEPGLALVHRNESILFVGTVGGLLTCDGVIVTILTPLAVAGKNEETVLRELQIQLDQPMTEMEVRNTINSIQTNILNELKDDRRRRARHPEAG